MRMCLVAKSTDRKSRKRSEGRNRETFINFWNKRLVVRSYKDALGKEQVKMTGEKDAKVGNADVLN